jgi:hypothetical protein
MKVVQLAKAAEDAKRNKEQSKLLDSSFSVKRGPKVKQRLPEEKQRPILPILNPLPGLLHFHTGDSCFLTSNC